MKFLHSITAATVMVLLQLGGGNAAAQADAPGQAQTTEVPPVMATTREDLEKTFGFCHTQRVRVEQVRQKFPALEAQVQEAEMEWGSAFALAEEGVTERLKTLAGAEWPATRARLAGELDAKAAAVTSGLTQEQAGEFLAEVRRRAKGNLESPQREMLLASDPRFVEKPEAEWQHGYTTLWTSQGNVKAQGLELSLRVPLSWKQISSDERGAAAVWKSDGGHGDDMMSVMIRKFPPTVTAEELSAVFTESVARQMFEKAGGRVNGFFNQKLNDMPVGVVNYVQSVERLGKTTDIHMVVFYVVHENALISVNFACSKPGEPADRADRIMRLIPLMKVVFSSLKLN